MEANEIFSDELDNVDEIWEAYAKGYNNGITVSANKLRLPRDVNPFIEINSTLLIPEKHYDMFIQKTVQHGGVRAYVGFLLRKYKLHIASGMIPFYRNHTTKYQEKGQNLIRVAFRPELDDWAELKLYRISFGMSISAFLVYLLLADFVDFAEVVSHYLTIVGISQSPNLDLWAKVYLSRKKSEYTVFFQYQPSPDG